LKIAIIIVTIAIRGGKSTAILIGIIAILQY